MPRRLRIVAARDRLDAWRHALEAAGYELTESAPELIVLSLPLTDGSDLLAMLDTGVPTLGVVGPDAWEQGMVAAIEGAARCIAEPVDPSALVSAVDAVIGPDAPPIAEQRRRARQRALTLLARFEARGAASDDDDQPRAVHLTRLEHRDPERRAPEPASLAEARRRLTALTTKQRGLLHVVEAEGSVSAAAVRLGTSRGNVYAGLRRIVHRLGVRDTGELLELVGRGDLLHAARS